MKRRDKRSARQKYEDYGSIWWELYDQEYYLEGFGSQHNDARCSPKLRRHQFHPQRDYPIYSKCPKWHNKLYHIRPVRRKEKLWCRKVTVFNYRWDVIEFGHVSEGMPYPSHKMHEYYW